MVRVTLEPELSPASEARPLRQLYGFSKGLYFDQGVDTIEYIRKMRL